MRIFHKVARADHSIFPRKKYKIVISWQAPTLICQANYLWPYTLKEPARPRQRPVSPKADRVTSGDWTCHLWSLCDHVSLVWWSLPLQTWPSLGLHLSGLGPPPVWQFVQFYKILSWGTQWGKLTQAKTRSRSWCDLLQFSRPVISFPSPLSPHILYHSQ